MPICTVYHLDLSDSLPLGTINLSTDFHSDNYYIDQYVSREYPNGVSRMGMYYLSVAPEDNPSKIKTNAVEYIFETVRRKYFPDRPSRMQSLFAAEDAAGIALWFEQLATNYDAAQVAQLAAQASVKIIQCESSVIFRADAMWRDYVARMSDGSRMYSSSFSHEMAFSYWRGDIEPQSRIELVLPLPVCVIDSTPLNDFLMSNGFDPIPLV